MLYGEANIQYSELIQNSEFCIGRGEKIYGSEATIGMQTQEICTHVM